MRNALELSRGDRYAALDWEAGNGESMSGRRPSEVRNPVDSHKSSELKYGIQCTKGFIKRQNGERNQHVYAPSLPYSDATWY